MSEEVKIEEAFKVYNRLFGTRREAEAYIERKGQSLKLVAQNDKLVKEDGREFIPVEMDGEVLDIIRYVDGKYSPIMSCYQPQYGSAEIRILKNEDFMSRLLTEEIDAMFFYNSSPKLFIRAIRKINADCEKPLDKSLILDIVEQAL